jgi:hypothetical protein
MTKQLIKIVKTFALGAFAIVMVAGSRITVKAAPEIMENGDVFDAQYYAEENPDVVAVAGTGKKALYNHYVQYGEAEGRMPIDNTTYELIQAYTRPSLTTEFKYSREKYTAEEAMAVYRSILESNGITWDPSIKEFASWGTGIMEYYKGYPEEAAQRELEGLAYGDGAGHSCTKYYFEINDTSKFYIYFTAWSC